MAPKDLLLPYKLGVRLSASDLDRIDAAAAVLALSRAAAAREALIVGLVTLERRAREQRVATAQAQQQLREARRQQLEMPVPVLPGFDD